MEQKTKIQAEDGRQDLIITREFDLPVALLFKAYTEPEIVEQWMGTKVVKLESKQHGCYRFETTDPKGNTHWFSGVIHQFSPGLKIIRTFEIDNTPFGVQLEIYEFEAQTKDRSMLRMHVIYETSTQRDQVLKLPFAQGINMAHKRLETVLNKLK